MLPNCISVPELKGDSLLIAQATFGTQIHTVVTVTTTFIRTEIIHFCVDLVCSSHPVLEDV